MRFVQKTFRNIFTFPFLLTNRPSNIVARGIMVENKSNIYIADKSITFGRDFCFDIRIRKIFSFTCKSTPDAFWHYKNEEILLIAHFFFQNHWTQITIDIYPSNHYIVGSIIISKK